MKIALINIIKPQEGSREGGMCLTKDDELADKMRILRNQGTKPEYRNKYYYDITGFNYRMTNMQAAVGSG